MSVNMQSTKQAKWTTRVWRTLAALDEGFLVSARRLTSGPQFLFQNCNALFQVLHRTDTD
jgi:hypothetical protein